MDRQIRAKLGRPLEGAIKLVWKGLVCFDDSAKKKYSVLPMNLF
jgi:hypothetical protein